MDRTPDKHVYLAKSDILSFRVERVVTRGKSIQKVRGKGEMSYPIP
jgi:hypothetical protein